MPQRFVISEYDEQGNPAVGIGAANAGAVTTSDTASLPTPTSGLYIGGAGDVAVVMKGGASVTFKAVPVGTVLKISVTKVMATGTTATNIVALY